MSETNRRRAALARAIAWWQKNRQQIAEKLPLTIDHVTYMPGFEERMDGLVAKYESGQFALQLAWVYIFTSLKHIKDYLEEVDA